jgi:uncharacterized protein YndB with AHSA1/START domain
MKPDWSSFTLRIPVNSSIESIYNALSTSAGTEKWFLASAEYTSDGGTSKDKNSRVEAGDTYLWKWFGYPGGTPEQGRSSKLTALTASNSPLPKIVSSPYPY